MGSRRERSRKFVCGVRWLCSLPSSSLKLTLPPSGTLIASVETLSMVSPAWFLALSKCTPRSVLLIVAHSFLLSPVPLASSLWGLSSVFLSGCPVGQHLRSPPPALLSLPTGTLLSSLFWEDRLIPTQQQCSLAGETSQSFGVWIHWAGVLHQSMMPSECGGYKQLLLRGPGGASGAWDMTRHLLSSLSPFEVGSQNTLPTFSKEIFKNPLSLPLCPLSFSHPRCEGGVFRVSGS